MRIPGGERVSATALVKAAVIGVGVIGGALAESLEAVGNEVMRHDPAKGMSCADQLGEAHVCFVCVPTPYDPDGGVDLTLVRAALHAIPEGMPTVIRSTVLPGTTEALQREFPGLPLLHAPEFLTEDRAKQDELYPARKVVGCTRKSKRFGDAVLRMMPSAPFELVTDASTAEMIKYFANVFYATSVSYVNQLYDLCESVGVSYDVVRLAAANDPMMSDSHLEVWHKGYRGYAGKCLPKDTRALLKLAERKGIDLGVVAAAQRYNDRLVGNGSEAHSEGSHPEQGPCARD